jgi:2-aminobenzoate-CoA ligase
MVEAVLGMRPCIHFDRRVFSYAAMLDMADRIAHVLLEDYGLVPGNRVLLRAPNNPMLVAAWFGVLKAGGICVTTMPLLRARELATLVDKAEIALALCDVRLAIEIEGARQRAPRLARIGYFTATGDGGDDGADLDTRMAAKRGGFANIDTAADDIALIAFTSGTTGAPKGTMHCHRDVLAICDCFPRSTLIADGGDVICGSPPLAFTFGLGALTLFPMRFGASTVLLEQFNPEILLQTVEDYGVTALYTAPTGYRTMADMVGRFDLRTLEKCVSAGEHLPKPTAELWREATGTRVIDGIGSTEMLHIFISASGDAVRPGSTGRAIPGYQAMIVDHDGNPLPDGEFGRLAVRGPTGCRYLADPSRQQGYVQNGWNLTGDVYMRDREGYFWYQARSDDMIISAGYNIAGPEIETVLLDHPKVRECAVVGAPDSQRGQIVKAFVVLRDAAEAHPDTVKLLQDFVKAEIAPYKYPRVIEFVPALPRTETGKLQRFRLREQEAAKRPPAPAD